MNTVFDLDGWTDDQVLDALATAADEGRPNAARVLDVLAEAMEKNGELSFVDRLVASGFVES